MKVKPGLNRSQDQNVYGKLFIKLFPINRVYKKCPTRSSNWTKLYENDDKDYEGLQGQEEDLSNPKLTRI